MFPDHASVPAAAHLRHGDSVGAVPRGVGGGGGGGVLIVSLLGHLGSAWGQTPGQVTQLALLTKAASTVRKRTIINESFYYHFLFI